MRLGVVVLLIDSNYNEWKYELSFDFHTSNNLTKYEALILGLYLACQLKENELVVYSDVWFNFL